MTKLLATTNKQQLREFKFLLQNPEYQHYPVTIKEYIESSECTNPEDKPRDHNKQLLIDIFDSKDENERLKNFGYYEEVLYIAGIGSGKSYIASKAMEYMVFRLLCFKDPAKYFNFAKGTKIAFINISKSFSQAKDVVFGEIKNRLDNSPWFSRFYQADPRIKSKIRLPKNIFILPLGSNEEAPLGYNIFGAVIDEASFHIITKDKDYAFESYNQIRKRIRSRFLSKGKTFIITSPRYVYDFAETKFRDDLSKRLYKRRTPLWEATPKEFYSGEKFDLGKYIKEREGVKIPIEYEDEFRQNPEKSLRDYGAEPSMAIQGLFRDPTIIASAVNKSRKSPIDNFGNFQEWFINSRASKNYDPERRFIHVDLALNKDGKGDAAGFAMGKFNGWEQVRTPDGRLERRPKIYIDYMEKIKARPKEEILFSDIRNKIYKIRDIGYNIALVSYDGWQCNLGSNKVKLLNGTSKRIDEIINSEWIYSYDLKKQKIVPALCKPVKKTGLKVPIYELEIDNGEKIHFTPEHLILMRDGTYKQVKDLKLNDSLMPLYIRKKFVWSSKYEQIYQINKKTKKWEFTHRMVTTEYYRKPNKDEVIHHIDFNRFNNIPTNLKIMLANKHTKMHKQLSKKNGYKVSKALKGVPKSLKHNLAVSNGVKLQWQNKSNEEKKLLSLKTSKKIKKLWENLEYRQHMSKAHIGQVGYWTGKKKSKETINKIRQTKLLNNHKVISIKFYGYEDVYDIEVPLTHNFGLSAGIFVHNSIDSIQTLKEKSFHVEVLSVDKTTEPYYTLKEALLTGRLDFYYNADLISELQQLEEVNGRKIDHPRNGAKDLSDAVAGVCYHCSKRTPGRGFLGAG